MSLVFEFLGVTKNRICAEKSELKRKNVSTVVPVFIFSQANVENSQLTLWAQAQKAHIDRTASDDEQSHNNLNKTLRFHQSIRENVYV